MDSLFLDVCVMDFIISIGPIRPCLHPLYLGQQPSLIKQNIYSCNNETLRKDVYVSGKLSTEMGCMEIITNTNTNLFAIIMEIG